MSRRRNAFCIRATLIIFLVLFAFLQMQFINNTDFHDQPIPETNYSAAAILSMVPPVFHKYLTTKPRNSSLSGLNSNHSYYSGGEIIRTPNITEIKRQIIRYNDAQIIINEDAFGPLQNDSVIIVVQVHKRITYLRHLIVSLAQAKDISKTLLIFSHDFYDEDINDLVQSVDFCKVMQIFYPYSIQTHPYEFPGADPDDCPRDIKKEQALKRNCNNALYPDLYGHYREAKFTQTKHHWWWKANRVFDQLDVTRYHTGLVLFLEEDHYVAEDFLYLLDLMQKKSHELCPKCNILSLGTYLKTFNYYTYSNKKNNKKAFFGQSYAASASNVMGLNYGNRNNINNNENVNNNNIINNNNNNINNNNNNNYINHNNNIIKNNNKHKTALLSSSSNSNVGNYDSNNNHINNNNINYDNNINNNIDNKNHYETSVTTEKNSAQSWGYQVLPSLYSIYQKVEVTPWISSKHNMGMALNRSTFHEIEKCGEHFCTYDDYNWDWSLQHVSQQCLEQKLYAMVVKGPRVFHIGECGVHHKKNNCESNQVISKVQQVIKIATKSGQLYPKSVTLTMASVIKKTKLRKGNGGWGDKRDHMLCLEMKGGER